jgi:hypothetical protein
MLSGDFLNALRVLNPRLRVYSLGDNGKMAGIYYLDSEGHYQDVCAIDKNQIPEFPAYDDAGHLVKAGWRRAIFILLQNHLTTTRRIRRLWPGFFMRREPKIAPPAKDAISQRLSQMASEGRESLLSIDEMLSIAKAIGRKDSPAVQENREHDRWFLKKWKESGGGASDRPVY